MAVDPQLAQAAALLRAGQVSQAESACRAVLAQSPRNGPAVHLLGLIRNNAGDIEGAEQLIRTSIEIDPQRPEFRINLAMLLRQAQRLQDAEQVCRGVLAMQPDHALAWAILGSVLGDQFRLPEAAAAYSRAIEAGEHSARTHHNLGAVLAQMDRAEEALEHLARAESLGFNVPLLHMNRGRALMQLYRLDDAERAFAEAVALEPRNPDAQLLLAQLRHMRGERDFARDLKTAAAPKDDPGLQLLLADILRRTGDLQSAEQLLRDLLTLTGPAPRIRAALAGTLHEAGRLREAELEALDAAAGAPRDAFVIETLVAIQLSLGRYHEALPFIRVQRERRPEDQRWLAYAATAARLAGDAIYPELFDYDRLVRLYDIEPPSGWSSIAELNAALAEVLKSRHPFVAHSFDQTLRNGSQTTRNLLADPDPVIQAVLEAFRAPLEDYCSKLGSDPGHPVSARNSGSARIAGAWSVQLHREGFHVNHVHAGGWISSAYYVSVPEEVEETTLRYGWLKFGEPRLPVPGATPERVVQPRAGRLVLFPSYMWHGTIPIQGPVPRTAISFDALPAAPAESRL
ncbi:MAG TPA: tetratricopeptide repeat protein [Steroidobacteraceae bacterium]